MLTKNLLFTTCLGLITTMLFAHGDNSYQFKENKGQWNKQVRYKTTLPNGFLYLENQGFTYDFQNTEKLFKLGALHANPTLQIDSTNFDLNGHVVKVHFNESNKHPSFLNEHPSSNYYNYIKGRDAKKWASNVHSFEKITYQNLYDNIDLQLYTSSFNLKYDVVVHPGGNPNEIEIEYTGADNVKLENGKLIVTTSVGSLIEQQPYAYQIIDGKKAKIDCEFKLKNNKLTFFFTNGYNNLHQLIIDPVLIFASYSGSTADNFGMTATYDSHGNLLSGGTVFDQGYPTSAGAYDVTSNPNGTTYGITDIVITKYDSTGATLIYSTYIGGGTTADGTETVHSLIVNDNDELYLFGVTSSNDFPMLGNSYDNSFGGGPAAQFTFNGTVFSAGTDIYVAKLSEDGTALLGATYMGGSANDGINYAVSGGTYNAVALYDSLTHNYGDQFRGEIMLDAQSNVYIASVTRSADFPIMGGFQPTYQGNQDGVIFKLSSDLSSLTWSSYLGGSDKDAGYSVKVDTSNNVYVAGGTVSTDFPTTTGVISENYNGGKVDGFIAKIDNTGGSIVSATYFGTGDYDQTYFLELDRFQDIYVIGQTAGSMPIVNVNYYNANGGQFVSKLNNNLDAIIYSTAFGDGSDINISPSAFLVDHCQNVYVSGWGANILQGTPMSGMPITSDALFPNPPDGFDFYLIVFKRDIDTLLYATYFGGGTSQEHVDGGTSRFDKNGVIYQSVCAGCGGNDDFPTTTNAWSNNNLSSNCNNGVFKMDFQILPNAEFTTADVEGCAPYTVNFVNSSSASESYLWDFGNGDTTSQIFSPVRIYSNPGNYLVKLSVTDSICQLTDTAYLTIVVHPVPFAEAGSDTLICEGDNAILGGAPTGPSNTAFNWDNSFTVNNQNAANPAATPTVNTLYTVIVTDINGCTAIDSILVSLNSVGLMIADSTATLCDSCIGTATATPLGGLSPYTYVWSDPSSQTAALANNLCSGNYSVIITDSIGCTNLTTVLIEDTSNIILSLANSTIPTCIDSCNALASTLGNGGTSPYSYLWNDPQNQTSATAINLCVGVYDATITDYYGCNAFTSVTITNPDSLSSISNFQVNNPCYNDCLGAATVDVTGGSSPYTYLWNDVTNQTSSTASGLCVGIYIITSTDTQGCITQTTVIISEPNELVSSSSSYAPSCSEICNGNASSSVIGGTSPYSYIWQTGEVIHSLTGLCPGTYNLSISDLNGCITSETVIVNPSSFSFGNIFITADSDSILLNTSTVLHANPDGNYNYNWVPGESLSDNGANPTASPLETQEYTLTISDSTGFCVFDTSIIITVYEVICENPYVFIPRAFTPNGDGENDILHVRGSTIKELNLEIFDRWGEKVFETKDQKVGWDATYKGMEVDPAVYVYYLTVICIDEQKYFEKGNITVIR
jgi:gliding motility-associated-like protein